VGCRHPDLPAGLRRRRILVGVDAGRDEGAHDLVGLDLVELAVQRLAAACGEQRACGERERQGTRHPGPREEFHGLPPAVRTAAGTAAGCRPTCGWRRWKSAPPGTGTGGTSSSFPSSAPA